MAQKFKTDRGFDIITFTDRYDHGCSLQKSSLATEDAIWLGVDDPEPKVMSSQAQQAKTQQMFLLAMFNPEGKNTGWSPYPIPEEVSFCTRMHLTQEQVKELLPFLIKFAETGEL